MTQRKPKLLTGEELSDMLSVSPGTIRSWARRGMPIARRGRRGDKTCPSLYHEVDVRQWREKRESERQELTQARARKDRAQALLAEQTVRLRARGLVWRVDADRVWAAEVDRICRNLRSWVKPLSRRLSKAASGGGLPAVQAALETAVHEKLTELSKPKQPAKKTRASKPAATDSKTCGSCSPR